MRYISFGYTFSTIYPLPWWERERERGEIKMSLKKCHIANNQD